MQHGVKRQKGFVSVCVGGGGEVPAAMSAWNSENISRAVSRKETLASGGKMKYMSSEEEGGAASAAPC